MNSTNHLDAAVAAAATLSPIALVDAARNTIEMHRAESDLTLRVIQGVEVPVTLSGLY